MTCSTCRFNTDGICRRWPPAMGAMAAVWPVVQAADWCGEHQERKAQAQIIPLTDAPKRRGRPPKAAGA